jgi:proteasome lid subunit RPN8/RPN11
MLKESLTEPIRSQIITHAQDGMIQMFPQEVCGVVMAVDGGGAEVIRSPNVHPNSTQAFALEPQILKMAQEGNCHAIYHSHPSPTHSRTLGHSDLLQSNRLGIPYLLYHYDAGFDLYDPNSANPYPLRLDNFDPKSLDSYLNIPWQWGRWDCGRLVYHYYLGTFDIKLKMPIVSRHQIEILAEGWNKYEDSLIANGFTKADQPQSGDIALMCLEGSNLHHGAVFVDADTLLHIDNPEAYSRLEKFHSDLQQKTNSIWRHPQLA